jgi:WD40 repeat protein
MNFAPARLFRLRLFSTLFIVLALSACSGTNTPTSSIEVAVKGAQAAAISDDGKFAIIGSIHHGGSLWRLSDSERLYNWNHKAGELSTIIAADFSADGQWALTANPHTMVLWSMKDGSSARYWTAPGTILDIALSSDGNYALLGLDDQSAVLFDIQRGGIKRTFHHKNRVRSVSLSADNKVALSGSEDFTANAWDVNTGKLISSMTHNDDIQQVALSPDGNIALSASQYDQAVVWDTRSGKSLGNVPLQAEKLRRGIRFTSAQFNQDGSRLLTGRPDQTVQLWNTNSMTEIERWKVPKRDAWKPTSAAVIAVGFSSKKGNYIAVASNGFIHTLQHKK